METTTAQPELLADMYDQGYNAYRNISFDPEKRAASIVRDYSAELAEDLTKLPAEEHEAYTAGYRSKLSAWLGAKSRCASTMITGPANFNTRRNEKANNSESNRYSEFREFREKYFARLKKAEQRAKTPEQKRAEFFEDFKRGLVSSIQTIIEIDNGANRYTSRPLIVSNMVGRIRTVAKKGDNELTLMVLNFLKEANEDPTLTKPIITKGHSIWKLQEVTEAARERAADFSAQENEEFLFDGGRVVLNYEANRLQITHDAKPDFDTRSQLKKNGFKWSPFNTCWQRLLNNGAKYAAMQITGVSFTKEA